MKRKIVIKKPEYEITEDVVKLTVYSKKGKAIVTIFDRADLEKVQTITSWYAQWDKDFDNYLVLSKTLKESNGKKIALKDVLPATILEVSPNAPIHHINGDILDNRKSNLKLYDRNQKNEFTQLDNQVIAIKLKNRYGYVVAETLISNEDLDHVVNENYTWIQQKRSNGQPIVIANTEEGRIILARHLMNCPTDSYVYHINKNPLDNRRQNLEIKQLETDDAVLSES